MSINSIDYSEISSVSSKWEHKDESATNIAEGKKQQAAARIHSELKSEWKADAGSQISQILNLFIMEVYIMIMQDTQEIQKKYY